jgi:proteasome lid subunit RPN8/RPN11
VNEPNDKIKNITVTIYDRKLPIKKIPRGNTDIWIGHFPNIPYLKVCWRLDSRLQVLKHAYSSPETEVGGVLLGTFFRTEAGGPDDLPIDFIEVSGSVRALYTNTTVGSLNFTEKSWQYMNRVHDQFFPDTQIVGWYHTHPGHGIFLSSHDLFIQNNFWAQQMQMALVIDTHKNSGAFFVDSKMMKGPYKGEEFVWDHELNQRLWRISLPGEAYLSTPMDNIAFSADPKIIEPAQTAGQPNIIISNEELPVHSPAPGPANLLPQKHLTTFQLISSILFTAITIGGSPLIWLFSGAFAFPYVWIVRGVALLILWAIALTAIYLTVRRVK